MGYRLPPRQGGTGSTGRSPMGPSMDDGPVMSDRPETQMQVDSDAGGSGGVGLGGVGLSAGRVGMPISLPGFKTAGTGTGVRGSIRFAKGGKVDGVAKKGKTKGKMVKMAKGGSVSSRADGCAKKGKTRGKMV